MCLGHTLTVLQEALTHPRWLQGSQAARKKEARQNGILEDFKTKCKEDGKTFEKEAPASTSYQFLYAVGNGDVWLLLELVITRYLGTEVVTILEATFNRERKPGGMKSTDFYYRLQQMNNGRKFLPGGHQANLTPEFIVWTGMLFNHAQKTQEKMKEFNLFNNIPKGSCDRSYSLRQIETLDELSYAAYQASKTSNEKSQKKPDKRGRTGNRNERKPSSKKSKIECGYCHRLGHSEDKCWKKNPNLHPSATSDKSNRKRKNEANEAI